MHWGLLASVFYHICRWHLILFHADCYRTYFSGITTVIWVRLKWLWERFFTIWNAFILFIYSLCMGPEAPLDKLSWKLNSFVKLLPCFIITLLLYVIIYYIIVVFYIILSYFILSWDLTDCLNRLSFCSNRFLIIFISLSVVEKGEK